MSTVSIEAYLTFDSRKSILEEIMKILKDSTKSSIGVYGLGGMGKTTLAKQVASRAAEEKLFDEIVMAPVTQNPELTEIQGEIAKKLGLKLEESSIAERAGRICERLKKSKVLVILDDLWEKLDLETVGIPFGHEHNGCKLLLTSRSRDVLSSMGTERYFSVEALGENEAWSLFAEKTIDLIKDPAFLSIGKEVAKRCAGLPVLIVTVAASLSSRPSLPVWKDALKELKKMNNKEVHEIVNSALELISYKHLQETHKLLFLLCGLFGSGLSVMDYLKYSWGWNFFDEDVVTLEEARNKLHTLILDLKASCLLLDGDEEDIIEIHDLVRDVAISLARKSQNMLAVGDGDTKLIRWPNDDVLGSCTAMFFDDCRDFSCLPERLECPLLEVFYLRRLSLYASSTIPDNFFQKTRELKVIDMTNLCFSGLPSSLSCLENLQTLCLYSCTNLEDIAMIGELKKLQVLSFSGSDIKELPRGIGQLFELRLLDLSWCSELDIIPAGLLAGLSKLEELYMRESFKRWEEEDCHSSNSGRSSNVSLAELKHLPKLHSLEIQVEDSKLLSQDFNFERLERYRIIAGDFSLMDSEIDKKRISRKVYLNLKNTTGMNHLQNGVKELLKRAEYLCLRELKGIKNVIGELDRDGFTDLNHLKIHTDYEIQFIINVELKQQRAFPALESLYLFELSKLEKICNGRLMQDSFGKLTTVNVQYCHKLETLFSFSMATCLPSLQELQVSDCSILKGIVAKKSDEDYNDAVSEKIEFVQLRKLLLEGLPQLMSFCCSAEEKLKYMKTSAQSSEIVSEEEEPSSSMGLFKEVSFPSLEELTLYEISNLTEMWNHKLLEQSYRSLKSLVVKHCACLVNVFSFNLLQLSRNLEVLQIYNCAELEELFVVPEELDIDERNGLVPQLVQLSLIDLPKLRCIWSNYHPSILSFKNLKELSVENCVNLKYLFTPSITMGLVQLQELTIKSCAMMKEIVVKEDGETIDAIIFPQLRYLCLEDLPNLTTFLSGDEEMGSNENTVIQPLFSEMVNLPVLMMLEICNLDSINSIWHNHPNEEDSICRLEGVYVRECAKLLKIFPSTMLNKIDSVKNIRIVDCEALEEVFEDQQVVNLKEITYDDVTIVSHQLRDLYLKNLPKLRFVWKKDFHKILCFENLCEVSVLKCESLKCIFPAYVARHLHQLEELHISDCSGLETIVEDEGDESKEVSPTTFTFPKLTKLYLSKLPKVGCFYPKNHASEWPLLYVLEVNECDKIFILELLHFSGKQHHNQFQKVLSNLEELSIRGKDTKMMTGQHSELFPNLRQLRITEFEDGDESSTVFPSDFLYGLHNLRTLCIENSSCEEIFPYEGEGEGEREEPSLLTWLRLYNLPELKYICTENSPFIPILQKLEDLWVMKCPGLTNVVPTASLSFKLLIYLQVEDCGGLIYVLMSSAAASLEQLKFLTIIRCEMIEEIVVADHHSLSQQDHHHEKILITFSKLSQLNLRELPRLTSFCTANNYTFNFPKLYRVEVSECPNMRTFSPGITIAPKLKQVYRGGGEMYWNGDLNTSIQHMFSEREAQRLTTTDPSTSSNNHVEPEAQSHEKPTETDICEEVVEEGKVADRCDKGKGKELEICEEKVLESAGNECQISNMSFKQHGESSLSGPSSRSLANEIKEQTNAESLASQDVVASSQLSPTSDHLETIPSLVALASSSQQKDVEGLRVTKHFIPLLSKVLQILQTQPLSSMSAEQVQFMEDASRDLSGMNFPMEWFCPYLEKARKCLSVVERTKVISELELKIAKIEAQLRALEENKKALNEAKKALEEENEAIASGMNLNKPLYDD